MRLSQHDASFLYGESASGPMHMASFAVLDGDVSFAAAVEHIGSRIHMIPRLRQRLAYVPFNLGHPKWVDDPAFNLDDHLFEEVVQPGTSVEQAVSEQLVLTEKLLDREKPLWRMHLIRGMQDAEGQPRTILLQVVHHAMIDGASAVQLSLTLFDLQPEPAKFPEPEPFEPAALPTPAELAAEAARENAEMLFSHNPFGAQSPEHMELMRRAAESMTRFVSQPAITAPWNAGIVGPKRNLAWRIFSFADVRTVRRSFGGTLNDVVLSVVSEAAAKYMAEKGEKFLPNGKMRVMCPVNVRSESESGELGNRVSALFPLFEPEPQGVVERLRQVRWQMEQLKQSREAHAMGLMMESAPSIPPVAMAPTLLVGTAFDPTRAAANMPLPLAPQFTPRLPNLGFNFTCTNVPGVQTPQYFAGAQLLDMYSMMMLSGNLGLGVAIYTYDQRVYFSLTGETRLMADVDRLADLLADTFEELLSAAQAELSGQAAG